MLCVKGFLPLFGPVRNDIERYRNLGFFSGGHHKPARWNIRKVLHLRWEVLDRFIQSQLLYVLGARGCRLSNTLNVNEACLDFKRILNELNGDLCDFGAIVKSIFPHASHT